MSGRGPAASSCAQGSEPGCGGGRPAAGVAMVGHDSRNTLSAGLSLCVLAWKGRARVASD